MRVTSELQFRNYALCLCGRGVHESDASYTASFLCFLHSLWRAVVCARCTFATAPNESLNRQLRQPESLSLSLSLSVARGAATRVQCVIARYDVRVVCVCGTPFRRQLLQNNIANQQRGLTAFTKADLLQSVVLASNHLPLVNNLSRNRQSFVTNIRDRENEGRTAAEEGMFTSTRKICFVLCGGRGTAIPRGRTEAQRGLAGYRAGDQRPTGPTAEKGLI